MKKHLIIPVFLLLTTTLLSCDFRMSLARLKYSEEEIQHFLENDLVQAEKYNSNLLETSSRIDFCNTAQMNNKNTKSFFLEEIPAAEDQGRNQCSGASSSFVFRYYGEEITGSQVYSKIYPKRFDGTVSPKPFKNYLDSRSDYQTYVVKGNINDLKDVVSRGIPVIVLINCTGGWHYVPIVGFDEKYVYIQDSVPEFRNVDNQPYNRKETFRSFKKLWNVMLPYCDHLMFIILEK